MGVRDIPPKRRQEIRSIKSAEEYRALTPEERTYYRLTEPIGAISSGEPQENPLMDDEKFKEFMEAVRASIEKRKQVEVEDDEYKAYMDKVLKRNTN